MRLGDDMKMNEDTAGEEENTQGTPVKSTDPTSKSKHQWFSTQSAL